MSNSAYKKLLNNSVLFSIGTLGSKLISLMLVPIYSYYLTTSEFGTVDILQSTVSLFIPLVTLCIYQALLRYLLLSNDKKIYTSNAYTLICTLLTLFIIIGAICDFIFEIKFYWHFILLLSFEIINTVLSHYARAVNKNIIFTLGGIVTTISICVGTIIFVIVLKQGAIGYIFGLLIGYLISNLFYLLTLKPFEFYDIKTVKSKHMLELIRFSFPLVPNALMWWFMTASSKYIVLLIFGTDESGLLASAMKIPSILTIITAVFINAWQLSAIEESKSDYRSTFYSNVFTYTYIFLSIVSFLVIACSREIFYYLFDENYYMAWKCVPFSTLAVMFSSLSSFFGAGYVAESKTKKIMTTSLLASFINIIFSLLLIPHYGAIGASISTMIGFIILWIVRMVYFDIYKEMNVNNINIIITFSIIIIEIVNVIFINPLYVRTVISIILLLLLLLHNLTTLLKLIKWLLSNFCG